MPSLPKSSSDFLGPPAQPGSSKPGPCEPTRYSGHLSRLMLLCAASLLVAACNAQPAALGCVVEHATVQVGDSYWQPTPEIKFAVHEKLGRNPLGKRLCPAEQAREGQVDSLHFVPKSPSATKDALRDAAVGIVEPTDVRQFAMATIAKGVKTSRFGGKSGGNEAVFETADNIIFQRFPNTYSTLDNSFNYIICNKTSLRLARDVKPVGMRCTQYSSVTPESQLRVTFYSNAWTPDSWVEMEEQIRKILSISRVR
jgi:hypothetical protein